MFSYHDKIEKMEYGPGVLLQILGHGQRVNALHWNMADQSVVPLHQHPEEQFGYVIQGGFEIKLDDKIYQLHAGDAYFIPPNAWHSFVALGETEAIDVFNPIKPNLPNGLKLV